jgi:excisionase family DNA binding protein
MSINPRDCASARITIPEIAKRLSIGRLAVYAMLEQNIIPAIRLGRRWIITRFAYENWERRCGKKETLLTNPDRVTCVS